MIDRPQRPGPRIDVGDPVRRLAGRIQISVENALAVAELELQAFAFADLQRGSPEPLHQLGRGQPDDRAAQLRGLRRLDWYLRRLRSGGAGG